MLEKLTRRLLGPYYHKHRLKNQNVFRLYPKYLAVDKLSRQEMLEIQNKKIKAVLIHARDNTEYYRELFHDYSFDPDKYESREQLQQLPPLSKDLIRKNIDRLLAKNYRADQRHQSKTGGTTGVSMDFYRNNDCRQHRVAIQWRSDHWAGWNPHDNIVYLWPITSDIFGQEGLKGTLVSRYVTGSDGLFFGKLDKDEFDAAMKRFMAFRPKIIRCFPSAVMLAAEYMREYKLTLPSVESIICTGEPLYSRDRRILTDVFDAEVYNLYAAREVGTIAGECHIHQGLHLALDSLYIEITENGRQLPTGKFGEILVTDLHNYGMPLIRYTIYDYGQITDRYCPCGMEYPMLEDAVGRTNDLFYNENGEPILTSTLESELIVHGPHVSQMQFIQKSVKEILVRITDDPRPSEANLNFYTEKLKEIIKGTVHVEFEIVKEIEREQSGKYRFAICQLSPEEIERLKRKRWER